MPGLRDGDIREVLTKELRRRYGQDPNTLVRHELGLCAGERRVDVAVINGEMSGYEIKSDTDTLTRLAGQAATYGRVFDLMSLVTTDRYLSAATALLPGWWGVIRVTAKMHMLETVRAPRANQTQDPFAIAQLLWKDEALAELRRRCLARGLSNKRRWVIWQRLATALPLVELQEVVRARLRERCEWPGGQ